MNKKTHKKVKTMAVRLSEAAKGAKISEELASKIIVREHALNNYYKKNELSAMNVNFTYETYNTVKNMADSLKVSVGSILCVFLEEQLKKQE